MIVMREARTEDCPQVFALSNEPVVRAASFSREPIDYADHVRWFERRLQKKDELFYLFFDGEILAGQIRFAREGTDFAEISISVSSSYRGKGNAVEMMRMALECLRARWGAICIKALVKIDNEASNKYFVRAGYKLSSRIIYKGSDCNVYFLALE